MQTNIVFDILFIQKKKKMNSEKQFGFNLTESIWINLDIVCIKINFIL